MRRALAATVLVLALAAPATAREDGLWATVNLCDPSWNPGALGVRASVPKHRSYQQWIRIRVQWFDASAGEWKPLDVKSRWKHVGHGHRTVEGGTTFVFDPPSAGHRLVLRGIADVQWRKGKRVKDRERLLTESGHAEPRNIRLEMSESTCEIRR